MGKASRRIELFLCQLALAHPPVPYDAGDAERLARFEREAKTLASLNHPNIAQFYGFEKTDGVRAIVMELVEGPTPADRIAAGESLSTRRCRSPGKSPRRSKPRRRRRIG